MNFETKEDIECPIAFVFAQAADFGGFERQALRRGADVRKRDRLEQYGLGSAWNIIFKFHNKDRELKADISSWDPPNAYAVTYATSGIDGLFTIDLVALSRSRTRLSVSISLEPKTFGARLLVQSLKLTRGSLQRRFELRVADFAGDITERFSKPA